jgi:hypothetical protein
MKMNKRVSIRGEFAKIGQDIRDGDIITILDGGTVITGQFGEQTAFHIQNPAGKELVLSFNQSSINNLIDAYGEDSESWKGKQARAWVVKMMVSNSLKNVAYLAHPDWVMTDDGRFVGTADAEMNSLNNPIEEDEIGF